LFSSNYSKLKTRTKVGESEKSVKGKIGYGGVRQMVCWSYREYKTRNRGGKGARNVTRQHLKRQIQPT